MYDKLFIYCCELVTQDSQCHYYLRKQYTYLIVFWRTVILVFWVKCMEIVMNRNDLLGPGWLLCLFLGLHDAYYRDKLGTDPLQKDWHLADIK